MKIKNWKRRVSLLLSTVIAVGTIAAVLPAAAVLANTEGDVVIAATSSTYLQKEKASRATLPMGAVQSYQPRSMMKAIPVGPF